MLFESDRLFLMLKTLLSTAMVLTMMASMTTFKYSKRRVFTSYIIYVIYALISTWIIILFGGWATVLKYFIVTLVVPAIILTYIVAKDHSMQAAFNYMTQLNLFMLLSATVTLLNTALYGNKITDLIARFILLGGAAILEYRYLRRPFSKIADSLNENWLAMILIPLAFSFLILVCALFPVHYTENIWGVIQLYAIGLVMVAVYYVIFRSLLKSLCLLEVRLEKDVMNAQLYAQKQYYENTFRREREVTANGIMVQTMLSENRAEEVSNFLEKWRTGRSAATYSANPYLNEVARLYAERFEEQDVPFSFDLQFGNTLLHDAEVFLILNNALENALEASLRLPKEKRFIKVQSHVVQCQFLVRISNQFDGKLVQSNDLPRSIKQLPGHGYGLSSIRAAAERTGGDMSFRVENDYFVLDVRTQIKMGPCDMTGK